MAWSFGSGPGHVFRFTPASHGPGTTCPRQRGTAEGRDLGDVITVTGPHPGNQPIVQLARTGAGNWIQGEGPPLAGGAIRPSSSRRDPRAPGGGWARYPREAPVGNLDA
jgi:hypothetical protein